MRLELRWTENTLLTDRTDGVCEQLPDLHCRFMIRQISENMFWVTIPTLVKESTTNKFPFTTKEEAKTFCTNFLNQNTANIIEDQIGRMSTPLPDQVKSISYYREFLDVLRSEKIKLEI